MSLLFWKMAQSTLPFIFSHRYRSLAPASPSLTCWTVGLHLRTISSNRPHPLAREGVLSFDIPIDAVLGNLAFNATLQLAYDMLSLSITIGPSSQGLRALVWNWKIGQCVFVNLFLRSSVILLEFYSGFMG
jgi:hypothetical protein